MKICYLSLLVLVFLSCETPAKTPSKPTPSKPKEESVDVAPALAEDLIYLEEMAKVEVVPQPILVVMHGYGSNERDPLGWGPALGDKFFMVSVRAPISLGKDRYAWYQRRGASEESVHQSADKVIDAIKGLPRTAKGQGAGDDDSVQSPLFIVGFSQGGRMAIEVAKRAPADLVQGAIAFSPARFKVDRLDVPTLITHGRQDKIVPFKSIELRAEKLKASKSPVQFEAFDGRHRIPRALLQKAQLWADAIYQSSK